MKKAIYLLILLSVNILQAQQPDWSFVESDYQYSMTLICRLNVNGRMLTSVNDKVAAFINGEVRSVSSPSYVDSLGDFFTYMTIFSNNQRETISFKIYDASTDAVVSINKTLSFVVNQHIGTLFQTVSVASPPLNTETEILDFSFAGVPLNDTVIDGNNYTLYIPNVVSKEFLVPNFEISEGAKMFINQQPQVSGDAPADFTNPLIYQVLSEDESSLSTYTFVVEYGFNDFDGNAFLDNEIYISEYLSPNGDGINDAWKIININYHPTSEIRVYSRNGKLVFNVMGYRNDWKGTRKGETLPEGNYFYQIDLEGDQSVENQGWIYLSK